jgi:hypothetical protein
MSKITVLKSIYLILNINLNLRTWFKVRVKVEVRGEAVY